MVSRTLRGRSVLFLLANGFQRDQTYPLMQCLQERGASVSIASFSERATLTSQDGQVQLISDYAFSMATTMAFQAIVVADSVTAGSVSTNHAVRELIASTWGRGDLLVTVGEGALVLIAAGIADEKQIADTPSIRNQLRSSGAQISDEPIVISTNVITARPDVDISTLCHNLAHYLAGGEWPARAA